MNDSSPSNSDPTAADDAARAPRYEQVVRWAEYVRDTPAAVWGPQQNAVVNGQVDSARAVGVSAAERKRIRAFADAELRASDERDESD
ncbi:MULTISPECIES: hypothetical protein [Halorubrum]|uniref:hypothetical protein n=1 Tax=Halorubrum TaxID=56688 RepID=UPI000F84F6C6|nr:MULTISPECIES: hypothetical protein [Halorubrum]AZQ13747.1 hypothetical protein DOS48_02320 [Halorubrum sp. PV6]